MTQDESTDYSVRAMTSDDDFRAVALRCSETAQGAAAAQGVDGGSARLFGELLAGAVLIRQTMAPQMRVQLILKEEDGGSMVADSHPDGMTRGLVHRRGGDLMLGDKTQLRVVRELPNGELQQGVVATRPDRGLSASLTTYMIRSEQVETAIGVAVSMQEGQIETAGGYIIQPMPEADRGLLAAIVERLETLGSVDELVEKTGACPDELLDAVLVESAFDVVDRTPIHFGCNCSTERFLTSLATLGRPDLMELVGGDEPLDITCDYCATEYRISTTRLRTLLEAM